MIFRKVWRDLSRSEQTVDRLSGGVTITDPATEAKHVLDWIAEAHYADGATTDDPTKPQLLWSAVDAATGLPVTIWIDGVATIATDLPFVVKATSPTTPYFLHNVPHVLNLLYTVTVKYFDPGPQDRAATASWQVTTVAV